MLLDDSVALDVPLDELAVHEPDARKLVAFLKAMEFSTLTKRVADYSEIDASEVTPDATLKSAAARNEAVADAPAMLPLGEPAAKGAPQAKPANGAKANDAGAWTPKALAAARADARPRHRDPRHGGPGDEGG